MEMAESSMQNYRLWLTQELAERKKRNPSYSLRAMSSAVGVSPGYLSKVMSGKSPLTRKSALKFAERLALSPDEKMRLLRSVDKEDRFLDEEGVSEDRLVLEVDTFRLISDWYHYAILVLSEMADCSSKPEWIARRLGISSREAREALDRLERLGLIEVREGRFQEISKPLATTSDIPSAALRKFHQQNLKKAESSLEQDSIEDRDFSSITMAVDPALLPEAKRMVKNFRRRLSRFLESGKKERVYVLALQLFPVDKKEGPYEDRSLHR